MKYRQLNSKEILKSKRFDGSYHNADINIYNSVITSHSSHTLSYYCSEIFTSGRNKRVYTKAEFGDPFLSNSDASSSDPFNTCKYSSKKYGYDESALLKGGMILTGRVGAIGQTVFVPKYWEKYRAQGSDNIIRIVVKPQFKNGFIYAYLASKIGNLSFWKHATGGVQPFITDKMVGQLPIPDFSESFQIEVDGLIQEAARLREEAICALEKAKDKVSKYCNNEFDNLECTQTNIVSVSSIVKSFKTRLDPPVYINKGVAWSKRQKHTKRLGDFNIKTWYPGIFKRAYVKNGLPYIKGSSVFNVNPFISCDHLSKARTPQLEELWLKEGMLLISCAGACGLVKMITKEYEDKGAIGSPDIIRLISNDELCTTEYLYVYLQLQHVYDYMQSLKYGSVIERFDIGNVKNIPIVIPSKELSEDITAIVRQYMDCTYRAFNAEEKAIRIVEQEIEKWNKH